MHDQRKARMAAQGNMSLSREFRGIQCDAKSAIRDGAEPMRGYLPQPLKRRKVDEVQGEADAHCDELNPSSPPLSPPLSVPSCLAPHNVGAFSQSLQQLPGRRRSAGRGGPLGMPARDTGHPFQRMGELVGGGAEPDPQPAG